MLSKASSVAQARAVRQHRNRDRSMTRAHSLGRAASAGPIRYQSMRRVASMIAPGARKCSTLPISSELS
ncbi:MAG: hypothetical protein AW06_001732 [Candidatus Accumulibacter cognatus]|uniref:Uncharacterized protein n=1 Tax=Candidatus Accumulibacter cognatus TaxID=2954383 RepID=A0A080M883_9PROT|nr:MAG: hypothetical protein AW06_001732 [Candidatus Accumulibacter cognatus]